MLTRRWVFVAGLVVCGCLAIQVAGHLAAQQNDIPKKSDKEFDSQKERREELELDARYAKAYLRVMELTQERYQEMNRRQPNTIPLSVMQVIQEGVREARARAIGRKG